MKKWLRTARRRLAAKLGPKARVKSRDPYLLTRHLITAPRPVVFDVGANVGETARRYRELFPDATLHCFEPFPPSFEQLRAALAGDAAANLHRFALADARGTASLTINRSAATNSLLASDGRAAHYWGGGLLDTEGSVVVETRTLDEFCGAAGIPRVDVLKLDVQGGEYAVLRGAEDLLARRCIELIYLEVIMAPTYVGQRKLHDYLALLDTHGYQLFDFYNPARRDGRLIQADVIFVSSDLLERYEGRMALPRQGGVG